MAAIVRSTHVLGRVQANGQRRLTVRHEWDDGFISELAHAPMDTGRMDIPKFVADQAAHLVIVRNRELGFIAAEQAALRNVAHTLDAAVKAGTLTREDAVRVGIEPRSRT